MRIVNFRFDDATTLSWKADRNCFIKAFVSLMSSAGAGAATLSQDPNIGASSFGKVYEVPIVSTFPTAQLNIPVEKDSTWYVASAWAGFPSFCQLYLEDIPADAP